ncbi:type II toxin-antitoxin system RelE/ParE family toxin [Sphingobium sp. H39-3-25]|uniref:type II toxin-antitoxin system RelE/ParE family toxin n=1 Tax=Sphingomonadales TaxID=204457 RepID=UPI0008346FDF|nr:MULTISPECIES: type II toxin-antitoxin system RelE/ParE family toxin [Sphingomonadaceae]MDF0491083.1 type II toxin-antitoxin system RelE/ParE family toxin [Sphingomonas pollutisoli]MDF0545186.1 type II toxin-antitoxin system RelE/ParE family toxin [Sphingobium arseniciresistens]
MTAKAVVPRAQAHRDVEDAIDHYAREAGADIALGFVEALEAAYRWIGEHPGTGSPRYAHELDLPGLRHRSLGRFPYLVFYVERADHIDVWRVLDARRDIPEWLHVSDDQ